MSPRMNWETQDNLDLLIAYGANPDVLHEYDFEPVRIRMVRNVLRLKGYSGDRMFKKVASPETKLPFVYGVIEHVYRQGFQNVPRFILNKYGDPFVVDETGQYYMTDWLIGHEMEVRKPRHLETIAEALGSFHNAAVGYKHEEMVFDTRDDIRSAWRRALAKLQTYRQAVHQRGSATEFDRVFLENYDFVTELIEDALYQLKHSPYTEVVARSRELHQVCHGSVSRQNILIDEDRVYFVDFDHCHYGPVVQDLASFLHRYMPRCEWDEDVVLSVIESYQQTRPLSPEELHLLNVYLQFPVRSVQLIEWYYEKLRDWDEKTYEESLLKALDHEEDREDFIDIMAEYYGIDLYDEQTAQQGGEQAGPAFAAAHATDSVKSDDTIHATGTQNTSRQERNVSINHTDLVETAGATSIPVRWSAESSSLGLIDDEVEEVEQETNRTYNNRRKRRPTSKTKVQKTTAAKKERAASTNQERSGSNSKPNQSNGVWIDPKISKRATVQESDDI
jgi:CotS family spore coat protein